MGREICTKTQSAVTTRVMPRGGHFVSTQMARPSVLKQQYRPAYRAGANAISAWADTQRCTAKPASAILRWAFGTGLKDVSAAELLPAPQHDLKLASEHFVHLRVIPATNTSF